MSKNRENYLWFLNMAPNKNCKKWRRGIGVELALELALPFRVRIETTREAVWKERFQWSVECCRVAVTHVP